MKREYFSCVIVDINFRGHVGQKATQKGDYAYAFGGRLDMTFDAFVLNSDELKVLEKELEKQSFDDGVGFFAGETQAALEQLRDDFEHFLNDDKKVEETVKEKKNQDDINPFSALFGGIGSLFKPAKKKEKTTKEIKAINDIQKENFVEKGVRELAEKSAKESLFAVYDVYKKVHGMASTPDKLDN